MALSDIGGRAPLAQTGEQAPFGGRRRAGARVVEREERRRATERGRDRVLEEPVRRRVRGHAGVGVHVDDAGEDQHPGRVHDLGRAASAEAAEVRVDGVDAAAAHGHVRSPRARRGHDGPTTDQEIDRRSHPPRIPSAVPSATTWRAVRAPSRRTSTGSAARSRRDRAGPARHSKRRCTSGRPRGRSARSRSRLANRPTRRPVRGRSCRWPDRRRRPGTRRSRPAPAGIVGCGHVLASQSGSIVQPMSTPHVASGCTSRAAKLSSSVP